ncbi:diguanylate cyclase [Vreelandella salicampi]|uniref:diguanylate cyclase n=1 Tax=Vreelandella salicampi TaxID=1449798 RepID=A0A7Z0LMV9_9GAMM|nr:diguanylate cyclase [Halomonas salicampi]NYS61805.1 diguanylate cyclase [Halomonas salicampi]
MPTPAATLQKKLHTLRRRFIAQLPERLAQASAQWQESQASTEASARLAPVLHRFFHSIKGTGRTLGFERLAILADQGETSLSAGGTTSLARVLTALEQEVQTLTSQHPGEFADIIDHHVEFPPAPQSSTHNKQQRLIYLCDDEPEQVDQLVHHLRCFGHEAVHFTDTERFFSAVLARRPDAVIMDVHFPQGQTAGTETLESLMRLTGESIPSIVLSSYSDFHSRLSAVRAGCHGYFTKPVKPLDLILAVDEITMPAGDEPLRVLVVDDEPDAADYHTLILEQAGMAVTQVNHPADALAALERFSPDLLLVDVYMPVCSGEELASIIRQQLEHVGLPIIYLSTETDREKQISAMSAGVEAFLTKPVSPTELVSAVRLRAERLRMLRSLMSRDSMTGLYNHSTTTELINKALALGHREDSQHTLVMIDIDCFKEVNDTHGHLAGDQVIITLARLLKSRLRNSDIIGRYGGEEFVVLLKNIDVSATAELINTLRHDFSRVDYHAGQQHFRCTFSAGISHFPSQPSTEALRLTADKALYRAKHQGRNQVVTYDA